MREGLDRCDRCWYGRQSCHLINPVKASGKMAAIQGRGYADWYRSKGYSYGAPSPSILLRALLELRTLTSYFA